MWKQYPKPLNTRNYENEDQHREALAHRDRRQVYLEEEEERRAAAFDGWDVDPLSRYA